MLHPLTTAPSVGERMVARCSSRSSAGALSMAAAMAVVLTAAAVKIIGSEAEGLDVALAHACEVIQSRRVYTLPPTPAPRPASPEPLEQARQAAAER